MHDQDMRLTAYQAGIEAAEANLRPDLNPYPVDSPDELAWRFGWLAAALSVLERATKHEGTRSLTKKDNVFVLRRSLIKP